MSAITCPGCSNPQGGIYMLACNACRIRNIARGQPFFESTKTRTLTPAYKAQCAALGEVKAVHEEVKAMAKGLKAVAA